MYLKIKDKDIPIVIKEYKTSKSIKFFYRNGILTITKPKYVPRYQVDLMLKQNEQWIYKKYIELIGKEKEAKWYDRGYIYYKGEKYETKGQYNDELNIKITIDNIGKVMTLTMPKQITTEEKEHYLDKAIKDLFKNNTEVMLNRKLPIWSERTGIKYNEFKVRDAITKYGSCVPKTKKLHFSSRLIMLPEDAVDAIIVHELCHIVHPNHSKDFYNLVKTYIPNYSKIDKWMKVNSKMIII